MVSINWQTSNFWQLVALKLGRQQYIKVKFHLVIDC